jgi:hypothetical protein
MPALDKSRQSLATFVHPSGMTKDPRPCVRFGVALPTVGRHVTAAVVPSRT